MEYQGVAFGLVSKDSGQKLKESSLDWDRGGEEPTGLQAVVSLLMASYWSTI